MTKLLYHILDGAIFRCQRQRQGLLFELSSSGWKTSKVGAAPDAEGKEGGWVGTVGIWLGTKTRIKTKDQT